MTRAVWLTDLHLNFLTTNQIERFAEAVREAKPDSVLISGDIGEAPTCIAYLKMLENYFAVPVYFVLGNHDFYHGSIETVRAQAAALTRESQYLRWLPRCGVVELAPDTGLIGHDGWADGRLGDFKNSHVMMNDYLLIEEFVSRQEMPLLGKLNALGDEAADYFREWLPAACQRYQNVIVLTHVPPFRDACWHDGKISDDNFLPHFASLAAGEIMRETMLAYPDNHLTVLCGHTHGGGIAQILPNLRVLTGSASYRQWKIEQVFAAH